MIFRRLKMWTILPFEMSRSYHPVTRRRISEERNSQQEIIGCNRNTVLNKDMELVVFGVPSTHRPHTGAR